MNEQNQSENSHNAPLQTEVKSPIGLLKSHRFLPYFLTQFLGAFNDNVFRNALVFIITYKLLSLADGYNSNVINNLAPALFILPFAVFAIIAGQIADKFPNHTLIRKIKLAEILIMSMVGIAFFAESLPLLLFCLFLTGIQSAFFSPIKYSILPKYLQTAELVGANAFVQMATFIAIVLGTLTGYFLIKAKVEILEILIPLTLIIIAAAGYISARYIPSAKAAEPSLRISYNLCTQTKKLFSLAQKDTNVFLAMLAVSWFWFLGTGYLSQLPNIVKINLSGEKDLLMIFLVIFSIAIGIGSALCIRLSGKRAELGLVPIAAVGLLLFTIDVYFSLTSFGQSLAQNIDIDNTATGLLSISDFLQAKGSYRLLFDFAALGIFGSLYVVPLNTYIQERAPRQYLARIIAANTIMNSIAMVTVSVLAIIVLGVVKLGIPEFFLIIAALHFLCMLWIFSRTKIFFIRFVIWLLTHTIYRIKHIDTDKYIPDEGAAVLIANHVSYVDALLIASSTQRMTRFIMYKPIYKSPALNWFFKLIGAIPICSKSEDEATYHAAFDKIDEYLKNGELVCIFPEGTITRDGNINEFKSGIEKIITRTPVTVIPMALQGLWGSFFSRKDNNIFQKPFRRFWSKVTVIAGPAKLPNDVTAEKLETIVRDLRGDKK